MKTDLMQTAQQIEDAVLIMKLEHFLHDKLMLYLLKKTQIKFNNKEFIFLANCNPQYQALYYRIFQDNPNFLELTGIPDALIYDTSNNTYMTIQYQHIWYTNLMDLTDVDFIRKCNKTTHIMSIVSNYADIFDTIYEIIKAHKCEFDVRIRDHYIGLDDPGFDILLREMDQIDTKFMEEQGIRVREDFFKDFCDQNYSKLKYDEEFIKVFYEFINVYHGQKNKWVWIPRLNTKV